MKRARRANQKVDGIVFELFVRIDGIERNRNKPVSRQLRVQKLECGFEGLGAEFRVKRINDTDFDFCLFSGEEVAEIKLNPARSPLKMAVDLIL